MYKKELEKINGADNELYYAGCSIASRKDVLAAEIWEKTEQLQTCTNGGYEAWVCPYGYHLVAW